MCSCIFMTSPFARSLFRVHLLNLWHVQVAGVSSKSEEPSFMESHNGPINTTVLSREEYYMRFRVVLRQGTSVFHFLCTTSAFASNPAVGSPCVS